MIQRARRFCHKGAGRKSNRNVVNGEAAVRSNSPRSAWGFSEVLTCTRRYPILHPKTSSPPDTPQGLGRGYLFARRDRPPKTQRAFVFVGGKVGASMIVKFQHWLPRTVGYEALLHAERREIHRQIAETIETRAPGAVQENGSTDDDLRDGVIVRTVFAEGMIPLAADLAGHWLQAERPRRAGLYLLLALLSPERTGQFNESARQADKASELLSRAGDRLALCQSRIARSRAMEMLSRYDEALAAHDLAEQAIAGMQGRVAEILRCRIGSGRGSSFWRMSRLEEAAAVLQPALAAAKRVGAALEEASAWNETGIVLDLLVRRAEAVEAYDRAIPLYELAGARSGLASALNNKGLALFSVGDLDAAAEFYSRSLAMRRTLGDRHGEGVALNNQSGISWTRGRLDECAELLSQSLAIKRVLGDRRGVATSLLNLGKVMLQVSGSGTASAVFSEALALGRLIGDRRVQVQAHLALGLASLLLGELEAARLSLDEASTLAARAGAKELLVASDCYRARLLALTGNEAEAVALADRAAIMAGDLDDRPAELIVRITVALCRRDAKLAKEAVERAKALDQPLDICEALLAEASIASGAGDLQLASRAVGEAAERAALMGAHAIERRARL